MMLVTLVSAFEQHLILSEPGYILFYRIVIQTNGFTESFLTLLDIDMQILIVVLNSLPYRSAVELAVLGSGRGILNLEKWLKDSILINRDSFVMVFVMCPFLSCALIFFWNQFLLINLHWIV